MEHSIDEMIEASFPASDRVRPGHRSWERAVLATEMTTRRPCCICSAWITSKLVFNPEPARKASLVDKQPAENCDTDLWRESANYPMARSASEGSFSLGGRSSR